MTRAAAALVPALLALAASTSAAAHAQAQPTAPPRRERMNVMATSEVSPDTVTVGDRFRLVLSGWVPPRTVLELEAPADSERVQFAAPPRVVSADTLSGAFRIAVEMVAWRAGQPDTLTTTARMVTRDGARTAVRIALKLPFVRSVLPPDTTKHVPRGAKDVWGPGRDWRMIALLAAALFLLLALVAWLVIRTIRRRRRRAQLPGTPRERALALLEQARTSGLAEDGNWKGFYTLVSDALRGYAADLDARWSTDLTTSELLAAMREDGVGEDAIAPLADVLRIADFAKFARGRRTPEGAQGDWQAARRWVETFAPPAREPDSDAESPSDAESGALVGAGAGGEAP